jgi:anti-sigma regulatory factor (Ser/Thr protein kinase)
MFTVVQDASQVAHSRRLLSDYAARAGLPESRVGKLAIVVSELATNLIKHAKGGEIFASSFDDADGTGIEVTSIDRGPGMADVVACMRDGFSSFGSLGQGLGAIQRQSDHMRIYSRPGLGTVVAVRFVTNPTVACSAVQCGVAAAPYPGELVSGDGWAIDCHDNDLTMLMADGSGHGADACRAATLAKDVFRDHATESCEDILARVHRALMPTRGGAVAIARVDRAAKIVRFVGVGNISGTLVTGDRPHHMVSHNGIAGHVAPRIREFTYPFSGNPLVILHSDGLSSRWNLSAYPGIMLQHPSLAAGLLFRDFRRGRDDASVVVARVTI